MADAKPLVMNFTELRRTDVETVGGKNASLGEMIQTLGSKGILVPPGFATTADAFSGLSNGPMIWTHRSVSHWMRWRQVKPPYTRQAKPSAT